MKAMTIRSAINTLQSAAVRIGDDKCLILSLTGSEIEDANINGMEIINQDESQYVEVRCDHPSLNRENS